MIVTRFQNRTVSLVIKKTKQLPEQVLDGVQVGLARGLVQVVSISQQEFMMGPRPGKLGEVTGRLRNSMTYKVERSKGAVRGHVGTNVKYGAYHEFGFHGIEKVKGFPRTIGQLNGAGKQIDTRRLHKDRAGNVILRESGKRAAARQKEGVVFVQFVRAHDRNVNYKGRPFTRPALEKGLPFVIEQVNQEIAKV